MKIGVCEICDKEIIPSKHKHHIDGDRNNNIESNFIYICGKCHRRIHHPGKKIHNKKMNNKEKTLIKKYSNIWYEKKRLRLQSENQGK